MYRPSTGKVYLRYELTTGVADHEFYYGIAGDIIIAGNWDNDGTDTVGAWRSPDDISDLYTSGWVRDQSGWSFIAIQRRGTLYLANANNNVAPDLILTDMIGIPVAGNFY